MSEERHVVAKNVAWNTFGSIFYLACQWLLSVAVVRFSSEADSYVNAGVLSLAMSITGVFFIVALFNVKNFQVTASESEFSDGDFVLHRFLSCALAFVLCVAFTLCMGYDGYTVLAVIAYMLLKAIEGVIDVYHGAAQTVWRLDIAGKSFVMRGIALVVSFCVVLILGGPLPLAIVAMGASSLILALVYDFPSISRLKGIKIRFDRGRIVSLTKICLPMVCYGICSNALFPIAKLLLEVNHGEEMLGYYASVSSIAMLVQALVSFVFSPLINLFNDAVKKNDKSAFYKLLLKLVGLLVGITLVALLASWLLGELALTIVFGESIRQYAHLLYPTIIISCLTAFVWLLGMLLVVLRKIALLCIGSVVGLLVGTVLSFVLIPELDYLGTNLAVIIGFAVISVFYVISLFGCPIGEASDSNITENING